MNWNISSSDSPRCRSNGTWTWSNVFREQVQPVRTVRRSMRRPQPRSVVVRAAMPAAPNASSGGDAQKDYENAFAKVHSCVISTERSMPLNPLWWITGIPISRLMPIIGWGNCIPRRINWMLLPRPLILSSVSSRNRARCRMRCTSWDWSRRGRARRRKVASCFEELVRQYPDSKAGGMAKDFLASGA